MKEEQFVNRRLDTWDKYEKVIESYERIGKNDTSLTAEEFVNLYRSIAHDLSIARSRYYSSSLVERLNQLTLQGHNFVYIKRLDVLRKVLHFFKFSFPSQVRRQYRYVLLSMLTFVIPGVIVGVNIVQDEEFVYHILTPIQIAEIEEMYHPENQQPGNRDAETNLAMFGFYLFNNTSIGLFIFVAGLVLGIGTLFMLLFNSISIGAVVTHLVTNGYSSTLLPFVIGHGAFELTAIVIAGAAGLRLAASIFAPGELSRKTSIRVGIRDTMVLVGGLVTMFIIAAFVEGFWSPLSTPPILRYVVGTMLWILVIGYFVFAGRDAPSKS